MKRDVNVDSLRFKRLYCLLYNMRISFSEFAQRLHLSEDDAMTILTAYRQQILSGERDDPRDRYGWRSH